MTESEIVVKFNDASPAEGNRLAESLREALADAGVSAERRRDRPDSMDFGASLVLVLGTPAVLAAVKAFRVWLARNNAVSLTFERPDGKLIATNLQSEHIAAIIKAAVGEHQ